MSITQVNYVKLNLKILNEASKAEITSSVNLFNLCHHQLSLVSRVKEPLLEKILKIVSSQTILS